MKYALLLIATILFAVPVSAEDYEKGPNGGLMLAGIDAELLTSGNTVTINVFEAFKNEAGVDEGLCRRGADRRRISPRNDYSCAPGGELAQGRGEESDPRRRDDHPHDQDRRGEVGPGQIQEIGLRMGRRIN